MNVSKETNPFDNANTSLVDKAEKTKNPHWTGRPEVSLEPLMIKGPIVADSSITDTSNTENVRRSRGLSLDILRKKHKFNPALADTEPPGLNRTACIPYFAESVRLGGRLKTFVVIQIYQGHQIIQNWKCNDLVQYVNNIAAEYKVLPKSRRDQKRLLSMLTCLPSKRLMENENGGCYDNFDTYDNLKTKVKAPMLQAPCQNTTQKNESAATISPLDFQGQPNDNNNVVHHHYHYHEHRVSRGRNKGSIMLNTKSSGGSKGEDYPQMPSSSPLFSPASQLTYRDLRQVFTDGNPVPSIEVRHHCIVLCLPPLSCIIMADRVFILVVEDLEMEGLISNLQSIQLVHMGHVDALLQRLGEEITPTFIKSRLFGSNILTTKESEEQQQQQSLMFSPSIMGTQHSTINKEQTFNELEKKTSLFPLEFESLELLISAAFEQLDNDILHLETQFDQVLADPKKDSPTREANEELHLLKNHTHIYQDRVALFDRAIDSIMSDPHEMILMELTQLKANQEYIAAVNLHDHINQPFNNNNNNNNRMGGSAIFDNVNDNPITEYTNDPRHYLLDGTSIMIDRPNPDLEILLEFFDQEIEAFRQRVQRLFEKMENRERLCRFQLALSRNRLLRWDVGSGMLAVAVGVGALLTGIFGMNLMSNLEDSSLGFYTVTIVIGILTFSAFCAVLILINIIKL